MCPQGLNSALATFSEQTRHSSIYNDTASNKVLQEHGKVLGRFLLEWRKTKSK